MSLFPILDAKLRIETREEIRRIQQEVKITTIFVTHDQEEAMSISDRIAVMKSGVVQQYEVPQTMYLNPDNLFVAQFLGMPQVNTFSVEVKGGSIYCNEHFCVLAVRLRTEHIQQEYVRSHLRLQMRVSQSRLPM